jgi:hypothetical protein
MPKNHFPKKIAHRNNAKKCHNNAKSVHVEKVKYREQKYPVRSSARREKRVDGKGRRGALLGW